MHTKRVIPCLDVKDGRVVKGVNFVNFRDAGYFGMIAFVVAEFMASMEWQIVC